MIIAILSTVEKIMFTICAKGLTRLTIQTEVITANSKSVFIKMDSVVVCC